jgi:hypothetical protein
MPEISEMKNKTIPGRNKVRDKIIFINRQT